MLQKDSQDVVRGYSIKKGNSTYKSSSLGKGRNLMPSKIEATWNELHKEVLQKKMQTYIIIGRIHTKNCKLQIMQGAETATVPISNIGTPFHQLELL